MQIKKEILRLDSTNRQRYLYLNDNRLEEPIHSLHVFEVYNVDPITNKESFSHFDVTFRTDQINELGERIYPKRKLSCVDFYPVGNDFYLRTIF